MKIAPFTPNPEIDAERQKLKAAYDAHIEVIRDSRDAPELLPALYRKEQKLNIKTKKHLNDNAFYYAQKRIYHVSKIVECEGLLTA